MTDQTPPALLASVRDLTRQVRIAQRGTWFPLLVFALLLLTAIPITRYGPQHPGPCRSDAAGHACSRVAPWLLVYWPVALLLAYAAIAAFYVHVARRRGVGSRIRPYVVVGVVVAVLVVAVALWTARHPLAPAAVQEPLTRLGEHAFTPAAAIGVALLVLARVERNPLLLAFSVVYLLIVLVPGSLLLPGFDRISAGSPWAFLPHLLIPAAVLLLGCLGFAVIRPWTGRRP